MQGIYKPTRHNHKIKKVKSQIQFLKCFLKADLKPAIETHLIQLSGRLSHIHSLGQKQKLSAIASDLGLRWFRLKPPLRDEV